MSDALREQLALLPEYLGRHLLLTISALVVGIGISFPLALVMTRIRWLRGPVLALASAIQTIPSLALLALMVPLLRAIGFLPAAIALTLYSMLPVIRNTVTGIDDVDPDLIEAGRGLGMTPIQLLSKVQIPLAMPVIIAGIRTATVWVVGIATLSTPVGATSLGNFIFSGLQTQNYTAVLVGCAAAAALALVLDLLIRQMEVASSRRSRMMLITALAGVALVLAGGLAPVLLSRGEIDDRRGVIIGAKTFTEQYILASLIARQLDAAGYRARQLESLGSTVVFDALVTGRIDCYVDYTGTIWTNHMEREDRASADDVLHEVTDWLREEHGIECLGRLGFENTYALAMRRDEAERMGIASIDDLFRHAFGMKIGGDYEFFGRPEWDRLLSEYELAFADTVGMDGTLMYSAVATGEIDVIAAFSTDGRIAANDLVVLDDPGSVFPPYDAVLLLGAAAAEDPNLRTALRPLVGAIDDERMRSANMQVDVQRASVDAVARRLHDAIR
ncbi:MAG: ABC transporter permease/substrate-binding protein [Planctomycetota bacterium]|jgi:osmoprotectant transport system permease protein